MLLLSHFTWYIRTLGQGSTPPTANFSLMDSNPGGSQDKIDQFLAELELKHLSGPRDVSSLSKQFSTRLDEFAKSVFENPELNKNFTNELRHGFGYALGAKMVEMLWDDFSPALGDPPSANPEPELFLVVPEQLFEEMEQRWSTLSLSFTRQSGVLLPKAKLERAEVGSLHFRAMELGRLPDADNIEELSEGILDLLHENAWRFLSFEQLSEKLKALWSSKPKLHQAAREERVPLRTYMFVMRHLLKSGVPLLEMDLILESLFLNLGLDDLGIIANNVLSETEELICGRKDGISTQAGKTYTTVDDLSLEVGSALAPLTDPAHPTNIIHAIRRARTLKAKLYGWVVPTVRLVVSDDIPASQVRLLVRGVTALVCDISVEEKLAVGAPAKLARLPGRDYIDPIFGALSKWIPESHSSKAQKLGLTIIDSLTVLGVSVCEIALQNAPKLFSYEQFDDILDGLQGAHPGVAHAFREPGELRALATDVFHNLLRERVAILDKVTILETILQRRYNLTRTADLTEYIRREIKESVVVSAVTDGTHVSAFGLSEELQSFLEHHVVNSTPRFQISFDLDFEQKEKLLTFFEKAFAGEPGRREVIVTNPYLRPALRHFLEARFPKIVVLSHEEIPTSHQLDIHTVLTRNE